MTDRNAYTVHVCLSECVWVSNGRLIDLLKMQRFLFPICADNTNRCLTIVWPDKQLKMYTIYSPPYEFSSRFPLLFWHKTKQKKNSFSMRPIPVICLQNAQKPNFWMNGMQNKRHTMAAGTQQLQIEWASLHTHTQTIFLSLTAYVPFATCDI